MGAGDSLPDAQPTSKEVSPDLNPSPSSNPKPNGRSLGLAGKAPSGGATRPQRTRVDIIM